MWHSGNVRVDLDDGCWRRNVLVTVLAILITTIQWHSLYISVEHQHSKDFTNIEVTNITVTSDSTTNTLHVHFSKHRQHMTLDYHKGKIFHLYNAIECFCWNNNRQSTLQQCQSMRLPRKDLLLNMISTWVSLSRQLRVCAARIFISFWNNIPAIAKIFFVENSKSENLKKIFWWDLDLFQNLKLHKRISYSVEYLLTEESSERPRSWSFLVVSGRSWWKNS